jgi:hypothetical protein
MGLQVRESAGAAIGAALFSKGKEAEVEPGTEFNIILNKAMLLRNTKAGITAIRR